MINPNEAPDGYVAVPCISIECGLSCQGCVFAVNAVECTNHGASCVPASRMDGELVIYIEETER